MQNSGPATNVPRADISCKCKNNIARWEANANLNNQAIGAQAIIGSLNSVATSSTTVSSVFYAIRIKKIILYTTAVVSSNVNVCSFEWFSPSGSTLGSEPSVFTGGSVGTAFGSKMVIVPPKHSIWSNWITLTAPGAVTMFTITCPNGTCFEMHYDAYCDNSDATYSPSVFSGLSTGANYRYGFDGVASATSNWKPLGYRTA
jgi:hypothetical protein